MTKTPYEVRLDVMAIAKDMLMKDIELKELEYRTMTKHDSTIPRVNMFSTQELISKTEELYSFVSNNSTIRNK